VELKGDKTQQGKGSALENWVGIGGVRVNKILCVCVLCLSFVTEKGKAINTPNIQSLLKGIRAPLTDG
jgi:hypothetical protein